MKIFRCRSFDAVPAQWGEFDDGNLRDRHEFRRRKTLTPPKKINRCRGTMSMKRSKKHDFNATSPTRQQSSRRCAACLPAAFSGLGQSHAVPNQTCCATPFRLRVADALMPMVAHTVTRRLLCEIENDDPALYQFQVAPT
ncbi:hypothetical protein [Polaromonas naphthalenivorans]|uniref:Uncharacterized protein n=1 Tax=Polaromonas naphthalenivorans (strain CJ2) TaxID=365044 RepID=A1VW47_POLNA|nr:hypothetical protein [Polaromonas naphthalenivorans]ABM39875.1 hypothetical protein Pnap_4607 [Polaromonas naphthalenivorans CJ2]